MIEGMLTATKSKQLHVPQIGLVNGDASMDTSSIRLHSSQGPVDGADYRMKVPNVSKRVSIAIITLSGRNSPFCASQDILYHCLRLRTRRACLDRALVVMETPQILPLCLQHIRRVAQAQVSTIGACNELSRVILLVQRSSVLPIRKAAWLKDHRSTAPQNGIGQHSSMRMPMVAGTLTKHRTVPV